MRFLRLNNAQGDGLLAMLWLYYILIRPHSYEDYPLSDPLQLERTPKAAFLQLVN